MTEKQSHAVAEEGVILLGAPSAYALRNLQQVLADKKIAWRRQSHNVILGSGWSLRFGIEDEAFVSRSVGRETLQFPVETESLLIGKAPKEGEQDWWVYGSDEKGLTYALYEVALAIKAEGREGDVLGGLDATREKPALRVRSAIRTMMNRDLDKEWFFSPSFWAAYLDNLVATRHNRFKLSVGWRSAYFSPPFPFLIAPAEYPNVSVAHVSEDERTRNLEMLKLISAMACDRGLEFFFDMYWMSHLPMGNWAEARRYQVEGLTAETIRDYTHKGVKTLLEACPHIMGLGISGSMMENGFSQEDMYSLFDGIADCGRPVAVQIELKGVTQQLVDQATQRGIPVTLGGKYCMEHQGLSYHPTQIRLEELDSKSARRWTRNSYADMLYQPRNHDFMFNLWNWGTLKVLLWGNPEMVSSLARNSLLSGSLGMEHGDPLTYKGSYSSGPEGSWRIVQDKELEYYDWEFRRYWLHYLLYGRLMFNPDCPAKIWEREFSVRFGKKAGAYLLEALAHASRALPLITMCHAPSASDNLYWPEIYTNVPIAIPAPESLSRDGGICFGSCNPGDTAMFYRVDDYVRDRLRNEVDAKVDPFTLHQWFQEIGTLALSRLQRSMRTETKQSSPEYRALCIDIKIQAYLAFFFGCKFQAAVHFGLYRETGDLASLEKAIAAYEEGLSSWRSLIQAAQGVYPAHMSFHRNGIMSGDWASREAAIVADLDQMKALRRNYLTLYGTQSLCFGHVPDWVQDSNRIVVATSMKGWENATSVRVIYVSDQDDSAKSKKLESNGNSPLFSTHLNVGRETRWLKYCLEATSTHGEKMCFPRKDPRHGLRITVGSKIGEPTCHHSPIEEFVPGQPLRIALTVQSNVDLARATLHYRHVNQAEKVKEKEMISSKGAFLGCIPASYTCSLYDILYYFSVIDRLGQRIPFPRF